jgi:hypothetical protein
MRKLRVHREKLPLAWAVAVALALTTAGCAKRTAPPPSPAAEFDVTLNASPLFESAQGWGRENPGGAVVGPGPDNKNVMSQRIGVYPGEPLKIVAQAASISPPAATGRLQINWVDAQEHPIGVSGKEFPLTLTPQRFEMQVSPPAGAAAGYLYVAPHGPQDVVRYTEMRLLTTACDPKAPEGAMTSGGCRRIQPSQAAQASK